MQDFEKLKLRIRQFGEERDWLQYHSPKNLSMALIVEAAELVEHFQWLTEAQSGELDPDRLRQVEEEIADIQIYLIRLADRLGIDLVGAVNRKLEINARKYPAEKVRGSNKKYTDYE